MLNSLVSALSERIPVLHRGNLIAMLVFYLKESLEGADLDQIHTFTDIVRWLDRAKGER